MKIKIEKLESEWKIIVKEVDKNDDPSTILDILEKAKKDLLTRVRELGSQVADFGARERLQDIAREIANYIFRKTGEFPSAAIAPLAYSATSLTDFISDISRLLKYAPAELIGREAETQLLDTAWAKVQSGESNRPRVLTFVALGGEGKTSLVAHWAADLSAQGWPGCDAAFAWSFYSQGTREQSAASSDVFLKEALAFFGDDEDRAFAARNAGAFEKGQRLAHIVGERKNLLILDGLEPLQYAPTSPTPGELRDQGLVALLKGLTQYNRGLCLVTTRYSLPDLKVFWKTTAPEVALRRLSRAAGVDLLKKLGVRGTAWEFETLVEDVKGHALTLTLLGGFLHRAFGGDIRKRDRVQFGKADVKIDGGRALRTMAAYEHWLLRDGGEEGQREVAVLRLLGLFDRPADAGCLAALRREPIAGLTEPLDGLADDDWAFCLSGLEAARLLTVNRDTTGALIALDAHPHLRAYFAQQLREMNTAAWRAAHRRLYEHLCASTSDQKDAPTLEDLQPLYQAVAHGCLAGQHSNSLKIYKKRILREQDFYSTMVIGAFGEDIGALRYFISPAIKLRKQEQIFVNRQMAFCLRATGRLIESMEFYKKLLHAKHEISSKILSKRVGDLRAAVSIYRLAGDLNGALKIAQEAMELKEQTDNDKWVALARLAHIEHEMGLFDFAREHYEEAQKVCGVGNYLSGITGFYFCDFLLSNCEYGRASKLADWLVEWHRAPQNSAASADTLVKLASLVASFKQKETSDPIKLFKEVADLLEKLRYGQRLDFYLEGISFTAYYLFSKISENPSFLFTQADLDEAWDIAERGPMRLHLADIYLHRARLFHAATPYPWDSPQADLAAARKLIEQCGYGRRLEELADAEAALGCAET